jgi:hypothetical protein
MYKSTGCAQFYSLSLSHHFATYEFSDRKSFDVEVKKFSSYAAKNKENIPRHRCAHIVPFLMFFSHCFRRGINKRILESKLEACF